LAAVAGVRHEAHDGVTVRFQQRAPRGRRARPAHACCRAGCDRRARTGASLMSGQNPALYIRVAATLDELRKNVAEAKGGIETTTAAMQKLASSFSGDKIIQAAHNVTAAVNSIGGASKLTEAEQARVNATVEKALEKYRALGREAPAHMVALA